MNEETLSKIFSFTVTVVIIIGFALVVNTFIYIIKENHFL